MALARGLNLQCNTPALSIVQGHHREQEAIWSVSTPRGVMNARKVILATNGYTAHLYPKLQGVIVPLRGFVTAQRPGTAMPAAGLSNTYSFIYRDGYEYMIPRPPGTTYAGDIVIGGGLTKVGSLCDLPFVRVCQFALWSTSILSRRIMDPTASALSKSDG